VNRHTKASSAGSSEGNGRGQGLLRNVSAARGLSGTGALSNRPSRIALVFAAALALVLVFGVTVASAAAPVVAVNNASSVEYTTAHVSGEIDPQGQPTTYRVQYVDSGTREFEISIGVSEWEFAATAKEATIEGSSQAVEADLTHLAPLTTYYVRLFAENAEGASEAVAASTFTTLGPVPPPTVSIEAPTAVTSSAAHFTGHIEPNAPAGNPSAFDVDWHFECNPECPGLSGGHITADNATHTVEADATGLLPGTAYEVTLSVANAASGASAGPEHFATAPVAPQIASQRAAPDFTEASLVAQINPGGAQTTYHFEYGPTSSYGQSTPATVIPAGTSSVKVEAGIFSLSPATEYHFRVVAENSVESVVTADQSFSTRSNSEASEACPNEIDRTGLSALLPDCRAYEQVSPVNKSGNDAGALSEKVKYSYSTPDGNAVLYGVRGAQGTPQRGLQNQAISRRGATGWTSQAAEPYGSAGLLNPAVNQVYSSLPSTDLSKLVFSNTTALVPGIPIVKEGREAGALYLADTLNQSLVWLSEPHTPNPLPAPGETGYGQVFQPAGATPDLSTVYFSARPTLLPEDEARQPHGGWGVYEYTNGELRSAGALPNGSFDPGGAIAANTAVTEENKRWAPGSARPEEAAGQVSADGSTFYFLSPDPLSKSGRAPQLYVRRNGTSHLVSHSQMTGEQASSGVQFASAMIQPSSPGISEPSGILGQAVYSAPDGSIAYFRSADQLTTDAPNDSSVKMYRYNVASGTVSYIPNVTGTIVAASQDGQRFLFASGSQIAIWDHGTILPIYAGSAVTVARPAKSTATGSVFVFTTDAAIPGFNNRPGSGIEQIYRYDFTSGTTTCVSCPPTGIAPSGAPAMSSVEGASRTEAEDDRVIANRGMSEDGKHIFFDTPDPLVPRDFNGRRDVYEWSEGGGTRLISSGKSGENSYFLENSANGEDVFIATTEGLLPQDTDGEYDVYDARVDGGFRSSSEVGACSGDGCQGKAPAPPIFGAPGSLTFSGPGNQAPHTVVKPRPLTRAQKLAKALKACHKVKAKRARVSCQKRARHAYGSVKPKPKAKSHKGGK
jgi:hypothetical protein